MGNSFGHIFRLTSFGESHGAGIGGVIDGFPAGIQLDQSFIQRELIRRRPGQSAFTTPRKEKDVVEFLSGIFEGRSTGCPIGFLVRNENQRSKDYSALAHLYRPSHADYTYQQKYGLRDYRGGGRSSARETIARCVAGALAKQALGEMGVRIAAYTSQIGTVSLTEDYHHYDLSLENIESNPVRCPDEKVAGAMEVEISKARAEGDTVGGIITCVIKGCPTGWGEPVFDKLHAMLGYAMLGINAVKGFEYGDGFAISSRRGSEVNDVFYNDNGTIRTRSNHSGGIQGGISNGEDIYFRVAFKPIATLIREQETVNDQGEDIRFTAGGRHDSCVIPRAVPIVEAMAAMTLLDAYLMSKTTHL